MHRDDWDAVYLNQDRILQALKSLEDELFLAGGTGLQRFILPRPYRHSEDLDFFFPKAQEKNTVIQMGEKMAELIDALPYASIEQTRRIKEEDAYRLWCRFDDNDEVVKVELLNFTCTRVKDTGFVLHPFKTENLYNLLLYKLKALCDRPDTIKDLFDLYFIFRELSQIETEELISDLNTKFADAINLRYEKKHIIRALEHDLKWDIEIADIAHPHDLKQEIEMFQEKLHNTLESDHVLDFSYATRIRQNAQMYDLNMDAYLELIEVLDENAFWIDEVLLKRRKQK
jgi:predicted nucleotidyltransferase component of viral defense system